MLWEYAKITTHLIAIVTVQTSIPTFITIMKGNRHLDNSSHFCKILCYSQKVRTVIIHPTPS